MTGDIKGEHEDLIFKNREFIQELSRVQDLYFETLMMELVDDGFKDELGEHLFDYIYNCDEEETFDEYLDKWR